MQLLKINNKRGSSESVDTESSPNYINWKKKIKLLEEYDHTA